MFIAIVLYCSILDDPTSCDVMIRKNYLFETKIECKQELESVAQSLLATGHYVKAKCFKFNPYGESA